MLRRRDGRDRVELEEAEPPHRVEDAARRAVEELCANRDATRMGDLALRRLGQRQDFFIARSQLSLGRSSYVGGILTDTEFGGGHNRVGGADLSLKLGHHSASAT